MTVARSGESLSLPGKPDAAPRARRFARGVLARWGVDELSGDVELVVAELVTNAVLHVGGEVTVSLRRTDDAVLVEVADTSRTTPVQPRAGSRGTTGRGLALVRALSTEHGVEVTPSGKTVWCLVDGATPDAGEDDPLAGWDDDGWGDEDGPAAGAGGTVQVEVGEAPTALVLAAEDHLDGVVRELVLADGGDGHGHGVPGDLRRSVHDAVLAVADLRRQIRRQAQAAADRAEERVHLVLDVPDDVAPAAERYLAALDAADVVARDARLLSLESPTEYRVVREWAVDAVVAGIAGPVTTSRTFTARLVSELHRLEQRARSAELGSRLQRITADLASTGSSAGIAEVALASAVGSLGAAGGFVCVGEPGAEQAGAPLVLLAEVGADVGVAPRLMALSDSPLRAVVGGGEAVYLESPAERDAAYPVLGEVQPQALALVVLPLLDDGTVLGALRLSFSSPRIFGAAERAFLEALAAQVVQALVRSRALETARNLQDEVDLLLGLAGDGSTSVRRTTVDLAVLRTFYGSAPVALSVVDPEGRFLRVNQLAGQETGLAPADHVGRRLEEVYRSRSGPLRERLEQVLATGVALDGVELEIPSASGRLTTWRSSWFPVRGVGERVEAVVVVASDVTAERAAEAARREAEARAGLLAEMGSRLAAATGVGEIVNEVTALLVPRWGAWCTVHVVGADSVVRHAATRHPDRAAQELLERLMGSVQVRADHPVGAGWVIGHGKSQQVPAIGADTVRLVSDGDEQFVTDLLSIGLGSATVVPLVARGRTLGALSVGRESPTVLDDPDLLLMEDVGRRMGVALDNAGSLADSIRLDLALSASEQGSFDWHLATGELVWDARLVQMFGFAPGGFDGTFDSFARTVHELDHEVLEQALTEALGGGPDLDLEYRVRRQDDGRVRWVHARGRGVPGPDGRPERFLGTAVDVTERRDQHDHVLRTLEESRDGFVSLDPDDRIAFVNREAERLLGSSRAGLVGRSLWEAVPALARTGLPGQVRATAAGAGPGRVEGLTGALGRDVVARVHPGPTGTSGTTLYLEDVGEVRSTRAERDRATARLVLLDELGRRLAATLDVVGGMDVLVEVLLDSLGDVVAVTWAPELREAGLRDVVVGSEPGTGERLAADDVAEGALTEARRAVLGGGAAVLLDGPGSRVPVPGWAAGAMVVPLAARGRVLGCLTLVRTRLDRPEPDLADLALAGEVAHRAGLMIDNARQLEDQRRVAETLQRSLLPELPRLPGVRTAAAYEPSSAHASVGGDWYDVFALPHDGVGLVIGDVMGHDIAAAAAMGQLRSVLRSVAAEGERPAVVLRRLDQLVDSFAMADLATVVYARLRLRPEGGAVLSYANAGHPPPLLLLPDGSSRFLRDGHSSLIGAPTDAPREQAQETLPAGAALVMVTDGLVERRGLDIEEQLSALQERAQRLWPTAPDLDAFCAALMAASRDGAADDAALLVVHLPA